MYLVYRVLGRGLVAGGVFDKYNNVRVGKKGGGFFFFGLGAQDLGLDAILQ